MNTINPQFNSIQTSGIWAGRKSVKVLFLKRHDLKENAEAFEAKAEETLRDTSPHNLLFLVEGTNNSFNEEVIFASNFVEENKVKIEDPIVNPFNTHIAREASVVPVHGALSRLVLDYLCLDSNQLAKLLTEITPDELIRYSVDAVAKEFGVSSKDLRKEFSLLSFQGGTDLQNEIKLLAELRQKLIDKSNIHSRKKLEEILSRNTEPSIFVMTGEAHEPVFKPTINEFSNPQEPIPCKKELGLKAESDIDSKTQIVVLQESIKLSGVEVLAAAYHWYIDPDWDAQYTDRNRCDYFGSNPPDWSKFEYWENNLDDFDKSAELTTASMLALVQIRIPKPLKRKLYLQSNLMLRAIDNPKRLSVLERIRLNLKGMFKGVVENFLSSSYVYINNSPFDIEMAAINAALTLRIIVEQIGNSLPDEGVIIQKLLSAPVPEARNHGSWAAFNTSKHEWRNKDSAIWGLINQVNKEPNSRIKRRVHLAVVSANPLFLFAKDENDRFIIYKGKDPKIERILVECAQESSPQIRERAFSVIGDYLTKHQIDDPSLDDILVKGLENKDQEVLRAINQRMKRGLINSPRLLPPLLKAAAYDSTSHNRSNALGAIGRYIDKVKINDPEIKVIARNNLSHENEDVRIGATDVFGLVISGEPVLEVQDDDISALLQIASSDSNKLSRSNATYALAVITNRNFDLIPEEKSDQVEHLCAVNRDQEVASTNELQAINEALNRLVTVSGLEDAKLLLELEEHPSRAKVEQLIRKKDKYRDAIGPLLERIGALYQANLKLGASLEALAAENLALREEAVLLRQRIRELAQELSRINASIKSKRINKLLSSIGGTAFRNIVKGRGIAHAEFVKSIFIDAGWDLGLGFFI